MFQLVPDSILYDTSDVACLDNVFKFAVIPDHFLGEVMESI